MATTTTLSAVIRLHPSDNVVVAVRTISAGEEITDGAERWQTREEIPAGHKLCTRPIAAGEEILKYGQVIGQATRPIVRGEWVHVHNVGRGSVELDYRIALDAPETEYFSQIETFQGYRRSDGRAATRNYIAVLSTVNCSATSARRVVEGIAPDLLERYPHVDGVIALTHKGGCAFEYRGTDHEQLNRTLAGFARHPNISGYLVLGLGCETGQGSYLLESRQLVHLEGSGQAPPQNPLLINIQEAGGVAKTVRKALEAVPELLQEADRARREPIPVSELILGTECGGSDGYSGITANPAIGVASDLLVRSGGTAILAETPEIYGGEHLLTRRACSREVGEKLLERIRWWEDHVGKFGQQIDNNPSVGNKQGGLTTIFEKSLGAISKGGTTALKAVYEYAEAVTEKGFVVMDTPGYDPASVTGMIAGGAHVVVFSTGRGSCFGSKPAPTIKICTNTPTYLRLQEDMDINTGDILEGVSLQEKGEEIFRKIVAVASGEKTLSEAQGIGDEEFCPWHVGPTY